MCVRECARARACNIRQLLKVTGIVADFTLAYTWTYTRVQTHTHTDCKSGLGFQVFVGVRSKLRLLAWGKGSCLLETESINKA